MTPYFSNSVATLYLGDCLDVVPTLAAGSVGLVVSDPPFGEATHKGAMTNKGRTGHESTTPPRIVSFASMNADGMRARIAALAHVATRWFVATMEWRHAGPLEIDPPAGWKFVRLGVWTKPDGAPQITGDRPAMGWEAVVIMHRDVPGKMRWNGGGKPAVWHCGVERSALYPTQKPLALVRQFVAMFAEPGDVALDPFCGSGTSLVAAIERGHRVIGCDISTKALDIAASRIEAACATPSMFAPTAAKAKQSSWTK